MKWHTETPKRLHQSRIGENVKQQIRALSIVKNVTISDITERALVDYIYKNEKQLKQYHLQQSKGIQ
jgi:hypothetical protein